MNIKIRNWVIVGFVNSFASTRTATVRTFLAFFCCLFFLSGYVCGQLVEFKDGKSLPLANESNILKAQELIGDKNWLAAAQEVIQIVDQNEGALFVLASAEKSRRFVSGETRGQMILCRWAKEAPEALSAYRELVAAESTELFEKAKKEDSVPGIRLVAKRYFASRIGDAATRLLAEVEFERGSFFAAASLWDSLIIIDGFPTSALLRYPDTDFSQLELAIRSLEASLLGLDFDTVDKKLSVVCDRFPQGPFSLFGKKGLDVDEFKASVEKEKKSLVPGGKRQGQGVDIRGRAFWQTEIEIETRDLSPFAKAKPTQTAQNDKAPSTFPIVHNSKIYWCDRHQIFEKQLTPMLTEGSAANELKKGTDSEEELKENKGTKIWSTLFPNRVVQAERKRIGRPVFEVEIDDDKLFARMGDPRTSYRNDQISRNRSYLIGLDLRNGGAVLPGFPLENEDPRLEFDALPVHQEGFLYTSTRRTFHDNASGQITIQCLELSQSNRAERLRVVWEKQIVTAESNNRGIWDEVSRSQLMIVEDALVFAGSGFVVSLQKTTGEVNWVSEYFRDRFEYSREESVRRRSPGPATRSSDQLLHRNGKLFIAPSDSDDIICLETGTGFCLWKTPFRFVSHLIGVEENQLVAGGNSLNWIDVQTGRLSARFPIGSNETGPQFGSPRLRSHGKATIDNGFVYWPTLNQIFVLGTQLDNRQAPTLYRMIDLTNRRTSGGNLWVENGIMLLTDESGIKAFAE